MNPHLTHLVDGLLDRAPDKHLVHCHGPLLAYAMSAVLGLSIVFWVEVQIVEDDRISLGE